MSCSSRCNGTSECTNNEDESECSGCIYGHFECTKIKECIPEVWVCDGMPDCGDRTDEDVSVCMNKDNEQDLKIRNSK